jgi:hypothetical protein
MQFSRASYNFLYGRNILFGIPFSSTFNTQILPLELATKFYTHTKQQVKLQLCMF